MIIDSHTHLNHESFINEIDKYIKDSSDNGVTSFVCVGWDLKSSIDAVRIANKYPNVYAAIGVHPSDVKDAKESDYEEIKALLKDKKVIAVGEIGLDYYYEKDEVEKQKQVDYFIKQIEMANEANLPVIIHSRDATNLTYEILRDHKVNKAGIIHCYAAGKDYVSRYLELGYYFGIGGVVTFKNAVSMKEAVRVIPINRILLESDAPYLTPVPFRGQSNHSKYIPYTAKCIAEIKQISVEEVINTTEKNFFDLFPVKH